VGDERAGEDEGGGVIAISQSRPGGLDEVGAYDGRVEHEQLAQVIDQVNVVLVDLTALHYSKVSDFVLARFRGVRAAAITEM
jgi:hypothetical protein